MRLAPRMYVQIVWIHVQQKMDCRVTLSVGGVGIAACTTANTTLIVSEAIYISVNGKLNGIMSFRQHSLLIYSHIRTAIFEKREDEMPQIFGDDFDDDDDEYLSKDLVSLVNVLSNKFNLYENYDSIDATIKFNTTIDTYSFYMISQESKVKNVYIYLIYIIYNPLIAAGLIGIVPLKSMMMRKQ